MAEAAEQAATPRLARALWLLGLVAAFIGNVTPPYGVLYWQWDTFQLLMLLDRSRHPAFWNPDAGLFCFCSLQMPSRS